MNYYCFLLLLPVYNICTKPTNFWREAADQTLNTLMTFKGHLKSQVMLLQLRTMVLVYLSYDQGTWFCVCAAQNLAHVLKVCTSTRLTYDCYLFYNSLKILCPKEKFDLKILLSSYQS